MDYKQRLMGFKNVLVCSALVLSLVLLSSETGSEVDVDQRVMWLIRGHDNVVQVSPVCLSAALLKNRFKTFGLREPFHRSYGQFRHFAGCTF